MSGALAHISVGVVVARRKAASQWIDYTWQPVDVLIGQPDAQPWTVLSENGDTTLFYAGSATLELFRSGTAHYRDNLAGDISLWVVLQPTGVDPPYELAKVTADPSEGEAYTEAGANIVEFVRMPDNLRELIAAFITEHHVDEPFFKRQRKRAEPEALGRRGPMQDRQGGRKS